VSLLDITTVSRSGRFTKITRSGRQCRSLNFSNDDRCAVSMSEVPVLTPDQFGRICRYAAPRIVALGEVVFSPGDLVHDLILIESGRIEIFSAPGDQEAPDVVASFGPGEFVGELNLLTGQSAYLTARVTAAGRLHILAPSRLRELMSQDPDASDVLLRTFLERRDALRSNSAAARGVEIIGYEGSARSLALRTYVARHRIAYQWIDADSVAGHALLHGIPLSSADLPAVLTHQEIIRHATPGKVGDALGLGALPDADTLVDLVVIGLGPAGLAAAVYAASEGLDTVVLDAIGVGGQAAASSRIENYLGFPSGISGEELTQRAAAQALKFGAHLSSPREVSGLTLDRENLEVTLTDGSALLTRAVVIATGARYRKLPLDGWARWEGAGIYYAATSLEAGQCAADPVTVLGGANSAGQAALFLAAQGSTVTLAVRGADIVDDMSSYLVERLRADARVTLCVRTEITALHGTGSLQQITLTDRATGSSHRQRCRGLFCFIGAQPATEWLTGVDLDENGFILTDIAVTRDGTDGAGGRCVALPFETSVPAVFAAGDVRAGSMKRVAAAVGEGASAVHSVHAAIGARV
jgi:thioredoxin reductase (NADPH)